MKKIISIVLAFVLVMSLGACGTSNTTTTTDDTTDSVVENEVTSDESTDSDVTEDEKANDEANSEIVTTGQIVDYGLDGLEMTTSQGDELYGQDADYGMTDEFSFTDNGDGTVTDNNTGLVWIEIPSDDKYSWEEAKEYCENLEYAGYDDWRLPSAEELFSLSDFSTGWPYLDEDYFSFPAESESMEGVAGGPQGGSPQGDSDSEDSSEEDSTEMKDVEQSIVDENDGDDSALMTEASVSKDQGQFWTSNYYLVDTDEAMKNVAFGVNHATGHIKAYPAEQTGMMSKHVRAVRGDVYGESDYVDNSDGTITDNSTGLMWMQDDSGEGMEWDDALVYAENFEYAGYDDWRLPDVKELQSIIDYSGCYPAIDQDSFNITELEENVNYYFWTNTSAYFSSAQPEYYYAWYVAFGYAVDNDGNDTHGAGGVRFSPKTLDSDGVGEGGDNVMNSVRLVRNIK